MTVISYIAALALCRQARLPIGKGALKRAEHEIKITIRRVAGQYKRGFYIRSYFFDTAAKILTLYCKDGQLDMPIKVGTERTNCLRFLTGLPAATLDVVKRVCLYPLYHDFDSRTGIAAPVLEEYLELI